MTTDKQPSYWRIRSKYGRQKILIDPETLRDSAYEFLEHLEEYPLYESKLVAYKGETQIVKVPKMRAATMEGFYRFIGISGALWRTWRQQQAPEYVTIMREVEALLRDQKFTGAAAELLSPNIIARDLGLRDNVDHSSEDGTMSPQPTVIERRIVRAPSRQPPMPGDDD